MIIKDLPKEISINKLKDLFGILKHTYSEIYTDEYGCIKGLSNYEYIIAMSTLMDSNPTYDLLKGRYISFNSSYPVLKDLKKKDARVVYDECGDLIGIINANDETKDMRSPGIWFYKPDMVPSLDVIRQEYNKIRAISKYEAKTMKTINEADNPSELLAFKTIIASKIFNGNFDNDSFTRIENMPNIDKTFIAKPEKLSQVTFKKYDDDIDAMYYYWSIVCDYDKPYMVNTEIIFRSIALN